MTKPFTLRVETRSVAASKGQQRAREISSPACCRRQTADGRPKKFLATLALALSLLATTAAHAHARGFHKRLTVVVHPKTVEVLVVMDIDGGGLKTQLLRAGADADHDGLLDAAEARTLKAQLVDLAKRPLQLSLSGYVLRPRVVDAKLSLRDDRRTSDTGLSIAAVLEADLPQPVFGGMELLCEDEAPDASHVRVEAQQDLGEAAEPTKAIPHAEADLQPGERLRLKLQSAM